MGNIFLFTIVLFVAIASGVAAESFFVFLSFLGVGSWFITKSSQNLRKQQTEAAFPVIEAHAKELRIRRRQLTTTQNYGLVDDSKWQQEIHLFITRVVGPATGYMEPGGDSYSSVWNKIVEVTADYHQERGEFHKDITPIDYEQLVSNTLSDHGWKTRLTAATGDQGIDVIAEKGNLKAVIQCKLYSKPVGNAAVQEALAGKLFEKADIAVVVTNAGFTKSAKQLAGTSGAILLHHDQLDDLEHMARALPPIELRSK